MGGIGLGAGVGVGVGCGGRGVSLIGGGVLICFFPVSPSFGKVS